MKPKYPRPYGQRFWDAACWCLAAAYCLAASIIVTWVW